MNCCGDWTGGDAYDCNKDGARTKPGTCACSCHDPRRKERMSRSERVTIQEQVRKLMSEHAPGATVNEKEEFLHGEVSVLRAPDRANPKAVRVARAIGKDETNKGPIAQARKDGYEVGLDDCRQALTNAKLD